MLTELRIREAARHRVMVLSTTMLGAVLAVFAYLLLLPDLRPSFAAAVGRSFGKEIADFGAVLIVAPAFAIFLVPCLLAERYVQRFAVVCPSCAVDISRSAWKTLATRRCAACGSRVLSGGRARSDSVYKRYREMQARRFLVYWFWAWPSLGCLAIGWWLVDPGFLRTCSHFLFVPGLIGTVAGAWIVCRTGDRRYRPQLIVSSLLLAIGGLAFWHAG